MDGKGSGSSLFQDTFLACFGKSEEKHGVLGHYNHNSNQNVNWLSPKNFIFRNITPCSTLKINLRFGRIYLFHLQGRYISQAIIQHDAGSNKKVCLLPAHASFLSGLFFDTED
jgi:hypothetical protein